MPPSNCSRRAHSCSSRRVGLHRARLVPELLDAGYRCGASCALRPRSSTPNGSTGSRSWPATWRATSPRPSRGRRAYYLIHAIGASRTGSSATVAPPRTSPGRRTRRGPRASSTSGARGGEGGPALSAHLASRHEVGAALGGGSAKVTELRAAVVIGAGSASFEMLRYLVEVLPVMITLDGWTPAASRSPSVTSCAASWRCSGAATPLAHDRARGPTSSLPKDDVGLRRGSGLRRRIIVPCRSSPRALEPLGGSRHALPRSLASLGQQLVNEVIVSGDGGAALLGGHSRATASPCPRLGTGPCDDGP